MYKIFHDIDPNPESNSHLAEIIESIRQNGWQGDPLLAIGDQLLTGSHRATACEILGIVPPVHQVQIGCTWGDGYDDLLLDLADANDTPSLWRALKALHEEGLLDDYSLELISREYEKEKDF